jgi:hypothetical protein
MLFRTPEVTLKVLVAPSRRLSIARFKRWLFPVRGLRTVLASLVAGGLLALPAAAFAQFSLGLTGTANLGYSSTVYARDAGTGETRSGDFSQQYSAGADAHYNWSRQKFDASIQSGDVNYSKLSELDHSPYSVSAGWRGGIGHYFDAGASISRFRQMVAFDTILGSDLIIQTSESKNVSLNLSGNPKWRLSTGAYKTVTDSPRVDVPELREVTKGTEAAFQYLGWTRLVAGIGAQHSTGNFRGGGSTEPTFRQSSGQFSLAYTLTQSSVNASMGYTRRTSPQDSNDAKALTGNLEIQRQLTAKVAMNLYARRVVNSYTADAGVAVNTMAALNLNYLLTRKIRLNANYARSESRLPGQEPDGGSRIDHARTAAIGAAYQPASWITLSAGWESRHSDLDSAD